MKKTLFVLVLLGVGIGGFYWREHRPRGENGELKLFGNVEIRQVLLGFRVFGRLEEIYFEEGTRIRSGDLLGALDPVPYEIQRTQQRAALYEARAKYAKLSSGYRPDEIRQAVAQRDQVAASLALAEIDYTRISHLHSQNAVSRQDLDSATSSRNQIRAQLASSEAGLALMREGYRAEDIQAAKAAVEVAEAQLRNAENALSDTKLYAPSDGTILTRVAEPGTVVAAGQAVYAVMLKNPVQVRAYVSEVQLGRVTLGMKGKIFTDSHPDPLEGVINFIASDAEFTPKQVQTEDLRTDLVYRIRLLVENNVGDRLKNGMPVTVVLEQPAGSK